jgi:hypothetical protein
MYRAITITFMLRYQHCWRPAQRSHRSPRRRAGLLAWFPARDHRAVFVDRIAFYDVRIYAFPNSGWCCDLGLFLGIAGAAGGGARYAT